MPYAEEARDLRANDRYGTPGGIGKWPSADQQMINAAKEFVAKLTYGFSPDSYYNPGFELYSSMTYINISQTF